MDKRACADRRRVPLSPRCQATAYRSSDLLPRPLSKIQIRCAPGAVAGLMEHSEIIRKTMHGKWIFAANVVLAIALAILGFLAKVLWDIAKARLGLPHSRLTLTPHQRSLRANRATSPHSLRKPPEYERITGWDCAWF